MVYTLSQIDNDFNFVISLLKKAIRSIEDEGGNQLDEGKEERLKNLLDLEKIVPKKMENELLLGNKEGGKAVMNIGEFLFMNYPDKRNVFFLYLFLLTSICRGFFIIYIIAIYLKTFLYCLFLFLIPKVDNFIE